MMSPLIRGGFDSGSFWFVEGEGLFSSETGAKTYVEVTDATAFGLFAGAKVDFSELYKKGPVVVFFYPKANTPGCTKQACSLRDAFADLSKDGKHVLVACVTKLKAGYRYLPRLLISLQSPPQAQT